VAVIVALASGTYVNGGTIDRRRCRRTTGSTSRLAATDCAWSDAPGFLVTLQYLADAAVRHAKCSADDARSDASRRQFNYLETDVTGQWTAVDEDSAQLIDPSLTFETQNYSLKLLTLLKQYLNISAHTKT
jgi:hypothetical protein